MKRLTTDQMLKVEGGCKYCMTPRPFSTAVPVTPTASASDLVTYLRHVLFH